MGDLDNSPLFDQRHIDFLRAMLLGRPLNPLSGVEQKFLRQYKIIEELDEIYEGKLLTKLAEYKKYIAVQTVIQFLVEARKFDVIPYAIEVLDSALIEEKGGELADLMKVLEQREVIPAAWAVTVYGENVKDRHSKETYTMPSGLNLEAMKNFK